MARAAFGGVIQQIHRIFGPGSVSGLGEAELLERFVERRDEAAFEAIVTRHGPMVLGVCRRLLDDANDVDDAFQATFLVLVRRAGSIRDGDRLGNWLYGVAHKVASRIRTDAARRRERERKGAAMSVFSTDGTTHDDLGPALHEELNRLPEKYRAPVVLCDLEGCTHDEAARRLRWPVGSVKGRLSRARNLLRERLSRRGITLSTGAITATLARDASASVPPVLLESTLQAAMQVAAGKAIAAGLVSATALAIAEGVNHAMFLSKLKLIAAGLVAAGVVVSGAGVYAYQATDEETDGGRTPPRAVTVEKKIVSAPRPEAGPIAQSLFDGFASSVGDLGLNLLTQDGFQTLEGAYTWSARAARAQLEHPGLNREGHIAAVQAHVDRMKRLETQVAQAIAKAKESGKDLAPEPVDPSDPAFGVPQRIARFYRVQAEAWLDEVRGGRTTASVNVRFALPTRFRRLKPRNRKRTGQRQSRSRSPRPTSRSPTRKRSRTPTRRPFWRRSNSRSIYPSRTARHWARRSTTSEARPRVRPYRLVCPSISIRPGPMLNQASRNQRHRKNA